MGGSIAGTFPVPAISGESMKKGKKDMPVFGGMDQEEQELYEERLFRDSFIKKPEEKGHALLVTVMALLALFLGLILFLYLCVFSAAGAA